MNALFGHRLAYLRSIGALLACALLASLAATDSSKAQAPAATSSVYVPMVTTFRLPGKIGLNIIYPSQEVAVVDGANFSVTTLATGYGAAWSPDGSKIAFHDARGISVGSNLYVMNANGSGQTKLSDTITIGYSPHWSPDGTKIIFLAQPIAPYYYWAIINANGTGEAELGSFIADEPVWSPDGSKIAFVGPGDDIYVMDVDGLNIEKIAESSGVDVTPRWSPDGTKIAFSSNANGPLIDAIFVVNADGSGRKQLTDGQTDSEYPAWSPDGSKIAYRTSPAILEAEIFVMNADGSGKRTLWRHTPDTLARPPIWSPDGAYVAFGVWGRLGASGGFWVVSLNGRVRFNATEAARPNINIDNPHWYE
jgi:Tol biopolymer transport system component